MAVTSRRGWAIRAVLCGLMCSGLPAACGIPDYRFVDQSLPDAGPDVTRPRCANDGECAKYPSTKLCDTNSGHCVECISTDGVSSSCGAGLFCNLNRCAVGCGSDGACPNGLTCDLATHHCHTCAADADCPSGTGCQDGECISACMTSATCQTGLECCTGSCSKLDSDPLHCGSCDKVCADGEDCINGKCGPGSACAPGFADCDGKTNNGCETNLNSDQKHCGSCQLDCMLEYCNGGTCSPLDCKAPLADCDHVQSNGCETNLQSVENCGSCGNSCSAINGQPACTDTGCSIVCNENFDDCDGRAETGCEVDLTRDLDNCGACGVSCTNENGRSVCQDGACKPTCDQGFDDCDGKPENGCETDIHATLTDCGACGQACKFENGVASCEQGVCTGTCKPGFDDCDGKQENGCEADLSSVTACGKCGNVCNENGGTPSCTGGACQIMCKPGRADCNKSLEDGCEVDTTSATRNCSTCGNVCVAPPTGSVACVESACVTSNCIAPLADCNGDFGTPGGNGCETNTSSDVKHCGDCGTSCYFPHAAASCANKACIMGACDAGWADCTAAPGCETQLGLTQNCTKCGESCTNANGTTSCGATGCAPKCAIGFDDCDGNPANGCETPLNSPTHCGSCTGTCSRPNATTSCSTGACQITTCAAGYGDCDHDGGASTNGCETRLNTLTNCGTCGGLCDKPHAAESCATGSCVQGGCDSGYADCSAALDGCETQLGSQSNCSMCGDSCQTVNAHVLENLCTGTVPSAICSPKCATGFKSCNANPSDGCETDITTPSNCGDCNVVCNLAHTATQQCVSASCQIGTCASGWANCNGTQSDGCERPVSSDITNCGGCNVTCSANHGTASCANSTCSIACAAGYGDCNTNLTDGCEHDVTSDPQACGNCATKCTGGTLFCVNSGCKAHLDVAVVNSNLTGSVASGVTLTLMHTLVNGSTTAGVKNYRAVLVGVAGRGNSGAGKPSSVMYGTQAMTLIQEVQTTNQAWGGIYAIADALLPAAAGTTNAVVLSPGNASNTFGMIANVVELKNVQQATTFVDASFSKAHGDCGGSDLPRDTIATVADGDFVYSLVGMYGPFASGTASSGQTITLQASTTSQVGALAGYLSPVAANSMLNVGWVPNACFTSAHVLAAIKAVTTP